MTMTVGSLFSGVGGMDLGLERAGCTVKWQCEIDKYACRVLNKHWPDVPKYGDVRQLTGHELEPVDLIAGGFPCTDISSAHTNGQREYLEGANSGLWSDFRRIVATRSPRWVLVENVSGWRSWVPRVRSDLHRLGYASVPVQLSAGSFGAPHIRPRAFVVAHADGNSQSLRAIYEQVANLRPLPAGSGEWRDAPPGGFRVADGLPDRVHRLRGLGNAVLPAAAEWIGRRILQEAS